MIFFSGNPLCFLKTPFDFSLPGPFAFVFWFPQKSGDLQLIIHPDERMLQSVNPPALFLAYYYLLISMKRAVKLLRLNEILQTLHFYTYYEDLDLNTPKFMFLNRIFFASVMCIFVNFHEQSTLCEVSRSHFINFLFFKHRFFSLSVQHSSQLYFCCCCCCFCKGPEIKQNNYLWIDTTPCPPSWYPIQQNFWIINNLQNKAQQ